MCLRHRRAASEAEMQRKPAAVREKDMKFSKVKKQCVLGSNPELKFILQSTAVV